jgi:hypothetical protein
MNVLKTIFILKFRIIFNNMFKYYGKKVIIYLMNGEAMQFKNVVYLKYNKYVLVIKNKIEDKICDNDIPMINIKRVEYLDKDVSTVLDF